MRHRRRSVANLRGLLRSDIDRACGSAAGDHRDAGELRNTNRQRTSSAALGAQPEAGQQPAAAAACTRAAAAAQQSLQDRGARGKRQRWGERHELGRTLTQRRLEVAAARAAAQMPADLHVAQRAPITV
ncbi:MAG: hypothetical protein LC790_08695 [Actinobacteria bacterium]|nr:hypothetical protein [Actinomycetota bacterium]